MFQLLLQPLYVLLQVSYLLVILLRRFTTQSLDRDIIWSKLSRWQREKHVMVLLTQLECLGGWVLKELAIPLLLLASLWRLLRKLNHLNLHLVVVFIEVERSREVLELIIDHVGHLFLIRGLLLLLRLDTSSFLLAVREPSSEIGRPIVVFVVLICVNIHIWLVGIRAGLWLEVVVVGVGYIEFVESLRDEIIAWRETMCGFVGMWVLAWSHRKIIFGLIWIACCLMFGGWIDIIVLINAR